MRVHLAPQPLGERHRRVENSAGKQQQKFFAPIPANAVDLPRLRRKDVRELLEDLISGGVTICVVHGLEVIDVTHHDGNRFVQPQRMLEHLLKPLLEGAAIVNAGKTIGQ